MLLNLFSSSSWKSTHVINTCQHITKQNELKMKEQVTHRWFSSCGLCFSLSYCRHTKQYTSFQHAEKKTCTYTEKNTEVSSSQLLKSKLRQQQDISQLFHFTKWRYAEQTLDIFSDYFLELRPNTEPLQTSWLSIAYLILFFNFSDVLVQQYKDI